MDHGFPSRRDSTGDLDHTPASGHEGAQTFSDQEALTCLPTAVFLRVGTTCFRITWGACEKYSFPSPMPDLSAGRENLNLHELPCGLPSPHITSSGFTCSVTCRLWSPEVDER